MPRAGYRTRARAHNRSSAIDERRGELRDFILANVLDDDAGHSTACWNWQRYCRSDGYGEADLDKGIGRVRVHRLFYRLFVGSIPDGLVLDHLCRNRRCCNPAHLEAVTAAENSRRVLPNYDPNRPRTHCAHGHDKSVVGTCANGNCKACHALQQKRWREKNPDKMREHRRRYEERCRLSLVKEGTL